VIAELLVLNRIGLDYLLTQIAVIHSYIHLAVCLV